LKDLKEKDRLYEKSNKYGYVKIKIPIPTGYNFENISKLEENQKMKITKELIIKLKEAGLCLHKPFHLRINNNDGLYYEGLAKK